MNNNGTFNATDARPNFHWTDTHTNTRNNNKIWPLDRPVPLNYEVPMDWHHMIPWNILRNWWSALATSGRWEVLEVWMALALVEDLDTRLSEMQASNLGTVDALEITGRMCWAKWNLVEGPNNTNRTDDPGGDAFDSFSGSKFSSKVRDRSQTLNQIYTRVSNWAYNNNTLSAGDGKSLISELEKLKPYKSSPISMFESSAWQMVNAGKIDKFGLTTSGGRHPTWCKVK